MSTLPLNTLEPRFATGRFLIRLAIAAMLGLVGILIYSGTAWFWVRPAIHKTTINKYAGEYKMDPLWVMAIIRVESRFAAHAQSPRGAVGLMQMMPATAKEIAPEIGLKNITEESLKDPDVNLHLGFHYLAKLQRQFPDDEVAVLAAYNAGPGVTREWRKGQPALEPNDIPYPETRRFVKQVQSTYSSLKSLQRWKHLFGID